MAEAARREKKLKEQLALAEARADAAEEKIFDANQAAERAEEDAIEADQDAQRFEDLARAYEKKYRALLAETEQLKVDIAQLQRELDARPSNTGREPPKEREGDGEDETQ